MHSLLARQLKKLNIDICPKQVREEDFAQLLAVVSRTYTSADEDRARLERSLEVSSREMHERTEEIRHLAFHDKLTQLPNRALFLDRVEFALAKSRRSKLGTAILFLDLDNFKLINDSLGHDAGDELLKVVASCLKGTVRLGDTVARMGGDEFTILLEDLYSVEDAERIANDIICALQAPITMPNSEIFAAASLGISFTNDPFISPNELIKEADTAMYQSKGRGKSCYTIFDEGMSRDAVERLDLENHLRQALSREELYVVYQPLVDMQTGTLSGAEALVRWNHPKRGLVPPNTFIPIAEEIGMIIPIGYWVMEVACRQMKKWRDETGNDLLEISVNLSGKQLQRKDAVSRIKEVIEKTGLPPEFLKLELTETILLTDRDDVCEKLHQLKDLGIKIVLDDFGTGYSSLSTLSSFPIDSLKIDRAFINHLEGESEAQAVVRAIIGLSRSMKMTVTAEGVETEFQRKFVSGLGCTTGQGFLFARPMPPSDFVHHLEAVPLTIPSAA